MKGLKYVIFLIPIVAFAFFLTFSPRNGANERYDDEGTVETLIIAATYSDCEENKCLQIKETPTEQFTTFDGAISGFEYVEGVEYTIRVNVLDGGSYEFKEMVSRITPNSTRMASSENYETEIVGDITELTTRILSEGYVDITVGSGDTVVANYTGWVASTGEIFESSLDGGDGSGVEFGLTSLIQGWQEGIPGMKIGEIRRIYIPSEKAYGEADTGTIAPNSDLIFDVEILGIK